MKQHFQKNNHSLMDLSWMDAMAVIFLKQQDALGQTTQYEYNVQDRIVSVIAPNNATTTYQYNDFGERLQETSPDRGTITYQYDHAGNVIQMTDGRGVTRQYTYDALNRIVTIRFLNTNENITYGYDTCTNGIGRLCQVTDASGSTTFAYDVYGNITQTTKTEIGQTAVTQYTYDNVDQITSITYPNGLTVNYQRDALSRITDITVNHSSLNQAQNLLSAIQYRADHLPTQMTQGNGLTDTRTYDQQGRLTQQQLSDNQFTRQYQYDANGNILAIDSHTQDPNYSYDALNRLTQETGIIDTSFTYDANSNRLSQLLNGTTVNYQYNTSTNQLTNVGASTLTVDASGNTLTEGNNRFTYNHRNQLETFSKNGIQTANYEYDYRNLRTQKNVANGTTNLYHYDLTGRRIQHDQNNNKHTSTIYLGWQPIAHIEHETNGTIKSITYLTSDQIGTPRLGTNQNKQVVWQWEADAFGTTQPNQDVDGDNQLIVIENRFPGTYYDAESGLEWNWHRYRNPQTGRYISSDWIGLDDGTNTYAYVGNNPLIYIDPYGLWKWGDPLPQGVVDFAAGFGDTITSGGTDWIRDQMGINGVVDKCSAGYSAGEWAGAGYGMAAVGAGLARAGLRVERGRWKEAGEWVVEKGKKKWHFHYGKGPGLKNHHLPSQGKSWWKNFKANAKRGDAMDDISNTIFAGYGAGIAASSFLRDDCEC